MKHFLATFCLFLAFSQAGLAQNALWRAVNESEPAVVPSFKGALSPFPFKVRPNEKTKDELAAEKELAESSRVKTLKADISTSLTRGVAITPNLSGVKVRGYIMGPTGPQVLIADTWYHEGESLKVKPILQRNVTRSLNELKRISPTQHTQVKQDLMAKISNLSVLKATISDIQPTYLVISSRYLSRNKRIPFEHLSIKK